MRTGSESAAALLLALVYPGTAEDWTAAQTEAFEAAVGEQAAYDGSSGTSGNIASEAVGDVRITYRDAGGPPTVLGEAVSPRAAAILLGAGLLSRWI